MTAVFNLLDSFCWRILNFIYVHYIYYIFGAKSATFCSKSMIFIGVKRIDISEWRVLVFEFTSKKYGILWGETCRYWRVKVVGFKVQLMGFYRYLEVKITYFWDKKYPIFYWVKPVGILLNIAFSSHSKNLINISFFSQSKGFSILNLLMFYLSVKVITFQCRTYEVKCLEIH